MTAAIAAAQESSGKAYADLIRANEQFGRSLLQQVHAGAPDRNVVVSPISLTVLFAALKQHAGSDEIFGKEIEKTFRWEPGLPLSVSAHQLLAGFEEPAKTKPCPPSSLQCLERVPQGAWVTNTFLYRSPRSKSPIDESFALDLEKNFKFKFVNTGSAAPTMKDLQRPRKHIGSLPDLSSKAGTPKDDLWISSGAHLQTAWKGNTFSLNEQHPGEFRTIAGNVKQAQFLDSEVTEYLYSKTASFEAVALPCDRAYMIAVLPSEGKNIQEIERELADNPGLLDRSLQRQEGSVTMPVFSIRSESDVRDSIEALGIKGVFADLGHLVRIPKSHLTKVAQKIDLQVTKNGIRADAETVAPAVYGGIMMAQNPFHMILNRPFVFLIRDEPTNALLFIGVVMDPTGN